MIVNYTKHNPLRCFFAFAGYDSQALLVYIDIVWKE